MIKTVTEWKKRFEVGTQFRQVWNHRQGNIDLLLTVTKVQTNGVFAKGPEDGLVSGWIPFPVKANITFTEKGWTRLYSYQPVATYEWVVSEIVEGSKEGEGEVAQ